MRRLQAAFAILLILAVSFFAPPAPAAAATTAVVTSEDGLNLRAAPSTAARIVGYLPPGARVTVTGDASNGWYPVSYQGVSGYAASAYLRPEGGSPAASAGARSAQIFDLNLSIPYHRQLTSVWCEAADIQSWYEYSYGVTVANSYAFQQETWDYELANNLGYTEAEWNASPYATAAAAHYWMPDRGFNHFKYDSALEATKMMAWLIANPDYREPSIAAIWRGDHYILVRGVRAIGDPYLDYPNAQILGVYVMDPNEGRPSWLGGNTYIPIDQWLGRHFTRIDYRNGPGEGVPGDQWQQKIVTVQRDWAPGGPSVRGRYNVTPWEYGG